MGAYGRLSRPGGAANDRKVGNCGHIGLARYRAGSDPTVICAAVGCIAPKAVTFPSLSRRVPLDSLCPDAAFAEHNTTTSSGKPARGALEQTELCRTMRSRSKRAPLMMAGATPASNEEANRVIFIRVEDIFAKYPIATS